MGAVFLTVLNMSLTGAFVIAALLLARFVLNKIHAPKWISYALWAVAAFRLAFPFSIESALSLVPRQLTDALKSAEQVEFSVPNVARNALAAVNPTINGSDKWIALPQLDSVMVNNRATWINPTDLLALIWIVGAAALFVYSVVSTIILRRKLRGAVHIKGNLYEHDNLKTPFVLGLLNPQIYIPSGLVQQERKYVVLHELTHVRRGDHLVKFGAYILLCVHWFNPLAWAAFLLMGADMEMSCDERVLKEMNKDGDIKVAYSMSLLNFATGRRLIGGSPLAFGEGGVKERVKNVLNFRKPKRIIVVTAVALVAALSVGFALNRASAETVAEKETFYQNSPVVVDGELTREQAETLASTYLAEFYGVDTSGRTLTLQHNTMNNEHELWDVYMSATEGDYAAEMRLDAFTGAPWYVYYRYYLPGTYHYPPDDKYVLEADEFHGVYTYPEIWNYSLPDGKPYEDASRQMIERTGALPDVAEISCEFIGRTDNVAENPQAGYVARVTVTASNGDYGVFLYSTLRDRPLYVEFAPWIVAGGGSSSKTQPTADEEIVSVVEGVNGATIELMPIDLTFDGKLDVPQLIEQLNASNYKAVYVDEDFCLRMTPDNAVEISRNSRLWENVATEDVSSTEFADWFLMNDPLPGYSMKETQARLANGASVKHAVFEDGKEIYFIIDATGVQLELVQRTKAYSALLDGQRLMFTFTQTQPTIVSSTLVRSFYSFLASCNIVSQNEADSMFDEMVTWFNKYDSNFSFKEVSTSPYKVAATLDEVWAALDNGHIPVTDIEVPEIVNEEVDGIIITEQPLEEALSVLNAAYEPGITKPTSHLVTKSVALGVLNASYEPGVTKPTKYLVTKFDDMSTSPYKVTETLDEVWAALDNGYIPVTDIEVPEIINGEVNGIIIAKHDLNESLAVLNHAYARTGMPINNLVTISTGMGDWLDGAGKFAKEIPIDTEFLTTLDVSVSAASLQFERSGEEYGEPRILIRSNYPNNYEYRVSYPSAGNGELSFNVGMVDTAGLKNPYLEIIFVLPERQYEKLTINANAASVNLVDFVADTMRFDFNASSLYTSGLSAKTVKVDANASSIAMQYDNALDNDLFVKANASALKINVVKGLNDSTVKITSRISTLKTDFQEPWAFNLKEVGGTEVYEGLSTGAHSLTIDASASAIKITD